MSYVFLTAVKTVSISGGYFYKPQYWSTTHNDGIFQLIVNYLETTKITHKNIHRSLFSIFGRIIQTQ